MNLTINKSIWEKLLNEKQFLNEHEDRDNLMIYEFLVNSGYDSAAKKFFKEADLSQLVEAPAAGQ